MKNVNRLFLIQGVFFFAYPGKPLNYYYFSGMIHPEEGDKPKKLVGDLRDEFGEATLSEITVSDTEIRFLKKYVHRDDSIAYRFEKSEHADLWTGYYKGVATGSCRANCTLKEIPLEFLTPTFR